MNRISILCFLLLAAGTLNAQLGNYDTGGSVPVVASRQRLQIDTAAARLQGSEQLATVLAGVVPPLLDLGSTLIQSSLKAAAARYESQFTVSASSSGFWVSEKQVMLPTLVITRDVMLKKEAGKGLQGAMRIVLKPELSMDRTAFRFVLAGPLTYRFSGARTLRQYDYINVDLLITIRSLVIDEGQYKLVSLRSTAVSLPMLKPGAESQKPEEPISSGWMPFPPPPSFEVISEAAEEQVRMVATSGTSNGKPDNDTLTTSTRTVVRNQPGVQKLYKNAGLYEFEVIVNESNPYRVKAGTRNELISRSADPAAEVIKAALQQ